MARPSKLNPELCAQIQARKRRGATYATIEKEFSLSRGSVAKALKADVPSDALAAAMKALGPAKKKRTKSASRKKRAKRRAGTEQLEPHERIHGIMVMLGELVEHAYDAEDAGDVDISALTRLITSLRSTMELAIKLEPPAPPDPNKNPDMVEAAAMAREKLLERVERRARRIART